MKRNTWKLNKTRYGTGNSSRKKNGHTLCRHITNVWLFKKSVTRNKADIDHLAMFPSIYFVRTHEVSENKSIR